jgi:hypothetical protein
VRGTQEQARDLVREYSGPRQLIPEDNWREGRATTYSERLLTFALAAQAERADKAEEALRLARDHIESALSAPSFAAAEASMQDALDVLAVRPSRGTPERSAEKRPSGQWDQCYCDRTYHRECPVHWELA